MRDILVVEIKRVYNNNITSENFERLCRRSRQMASVLQQSLYIWGGWFDFAVQRRKVLANLGIEDHRVEKALLLQGQ